MKTNYKIAVARHRRNKKFCKKLIKYLLSKKIEKTIFKTAPAAFLILGMLVLNVYPTDAYFNDTESSSGDTFSAGILDISVSGMSVSGTVLPGNATTTGIVISKASAANLDYQYFASTTILDADQTACGYITLSASSSPQSYSGLLKNFVSAASAPANEAQWDLRFEVSSDVSTADLGKVCNFKMTFSAWQTDLPDSSQGFSDIEEVAGSIQVGQAPLPPSVVLNEFLPDPAGSDSDSMPNGEWVELYNNTDSPIDLNGYYLTDAGNHKVYIEGCRIMGGSRVINGKGFLVVYRKGNAGCTSSSFSMNNSGGDTVSLHDAGGAILDSRIYYGSDENKSIARIPDGTGEWVDPIPTLGEPNKMEEILGDGSADALFVATITDSDITSSTTSEIIIETATTTELISTTTPSADSGQASTTPEIIGPEPAVIPPEPEIITEPVVEPAPIIESTPVIEIPVPELTASTPNE